MVGQGTAAKDRAATCPSRGESSRRVAPTGGHWQAARRQVEESSDRMLQR